MQQSPAPPFLRSTGPRVLSPSAMLELCPSRARVSRRRTTVRVQAVPHVEHAAAVTPATATSAGVQCTAHGEALHACYLHAVFFFTLRFFFLLFN